MSRIASLVIGTLIGVMISLGLPANAETNSTCELDSVGCTGTTTFTNIRRGDGLFIQQIEVNGGTIQRAEWYWPFVNPTVNAHMAAGDKSTKWSYVNTETSSARTESAKVQRLKSKVRELRAKVYRLRNR